MSQTRDQQHFTISEVADWHEPVVLQRIMWSSSLPVLTDNWTHGAASRHTIAPISHTRLSPLFTCAANITTAWCQVNTPILNPLFLGTVPNVGLDMDQTRAHSENVNLNQRWP